MGEVVKIAILSSLVMAATGCNAILKVVTSTGGTIPGSKYASSLALTDPSELPPCTAARANQLTYVESENGFFVCRTENWTPLAVQFKGEKGEDGVNGNDGAAGAKGAKGDTGETGDNGAKGDPGAAAQFPVGTIMWLGSTTVPAGWIECTGALIPIVTYPELFAVLGTYFGGDGTTNFAVPDMRGRVPIGQGTGPGLTTYSIAQKGGIENINLTQAQMPPHDHSFRIPIDNGGADQDDPQGHFPGAGGVDIYSNTANALSGEGTTDSSGSGSSVPIVQPFVGLTCLIYAGI